MVNGSQEHSSRWGLAGKSAKLTRWKTVSPETVCAAVRQAFTKSANIPACCCWPVFNVSVLHHLELFLIDFRIKAQWCLRHFFCFILPLERRENGTKRKICLLKSRILAFGFSLFYPCRQVTLITIFFSLNIGFQGQSQAMCLLRSLLCHTWYCNYPILFWHSRI